MPKRGEVRWVSGYEGLYSVSDAGEVFSHKTGKGASATTLKQHQSTKGYSLVRLYDSDKKGKTLRVHRLVAIAFLDNPHNLPHINHKNRIKTDNSIDNLEWCTAQYNSEYSVAKNYKLINKDGVIVEVFNMEKWCKDNGMHSSSMGRMLSGGRKTYRGWSKYA